MFVSSGIAIGGERPWSGGACPEPWVDIRFPDDADLSIDAPAGTTKAWRLFGKTPPGWARVQAICDFIHRHIAFGASMRARP
jgi:hypothetical protein